MLRLARFLLARSRARRSRRVRRGALPAPLVAASGRAATGGLSAARRRVGQAVAVAGQDGFFLNRVVNLHAKEAANDVAADRGDEFAEHLEGFALERDSGSCCP